MDIQNKVILISGGVSGLGEATSIALSNKGGKVVMLDINEEKGNKLKDTLKDSLFIRTDITQTSSDFDTLIFLPFGRCPHLFLPQAAVNSTGLLNSASPSGNLFIFPVYRLTSFAACHFQENFVTRSMCSGQNIL